MRYLVILFYALFITMPCFSQVVFPSGITRIEGYQFENKSIKGEVVIPDTVTYIGESSFAGNEISSVRLTGGVSSIEKLAFAYNKISDLVLTSDLNYIGRFAFYSNELTSIEFPIGLLYIDDSAFARNNISEIILPESLGMIRRSAFSRNNISNINIPTSVITIESYAFYNNNIEDIVIPSSLKGLGDSTFANNQIINLLIEDGIKYIPYRCFAGNKITKVKIPNSVISIGECAFQNNKVTSISIPNDCMVDVGAFDGNKITSIIFEGSDISYEASGEGENGKKYITFGDYGIAFDAFFLRNKKRAGIYSYDITDGWSFQYSDTNLPFSEFFKRNIWNIISLIFGSIGAIFGVISLVKRRVRKPVYSKSDEYDIVDRIEDDNNLKLFWNDNMINNIRVVKISFWNRGKIIIKKEDISDTEPIEIYCDNQAVKILKCFISKISRKSIQLNIDTKIDSLKIIIANNEAFEYKDGFEITIYYTRYFTLSNDDWKIKGRIHEVKAIKDIDGVSKVKKIISELFYLSPYYIMAFISGVGVSYSGRFILDKLGVVKDIQVYFIHPIMVIICIVFIYLGFKHKRAYRMPKWNKTG